MDAGWSAAECERGAAAVEAALRDLLSPTAVSVVAAAVRAAREAFDGDALARRCGETRRSLYRHLSQELSLTPRRVHAWGRIVASARMLGDGTRGMEEVALALGMDGSAALGHLYRRHAGTTPGRVRECGGEGYAIELFLRLLSKQRGE